MESFECTVGPLADVREFEFIIALQQTCPGYTRVSATISSLDVMRFVMSRYAVDITHNQANDIILGLGGGLLSSDVRKGVADIVASKHKQQHQQKQQAIYGGGTSDIEGVSASRMVMQEETASADPPSPSSAAKMSYHERFKSVNASRHSKKEEQALIEQKMTESAIIDEILNPKLIYLDMVQMVSVLLIPTLTRYVKEWRFKNHATTAHNEAGAAYQDELERVQRRLAGNNRSGGGPSISVQSDHASVEVGVSETESNTFDVKA